MSQGGRTSLGSYYEGKVAVVTGAGSGIGRALAVRLAGEGAVLALLDRDGPAVDGTARQCRDAGAQAREHVVDVTDYDALARCAAEAAAGPGRVDVLLAAAGVIHTGPLLASAWQDTARVVEVNLLGAMGTLHAFLPALAASGDGRAVLCSSGFGLLAMPRYAAYSASKHGIRGLAEAAAAEMALGGHRVRVTCAYPGVVRTPIIRSGTAAAGVDQEAVAARFDELARTSPERAAEVILHATRRGRARVIVGPDARLAALAVQVLGSAVPQMVTLASRRAGRRAS